MWRHKASSQLNWDMSASCLLFLNLVVIGLLYMAYLDGRRHIYLSAKAQTLPFEGASAHVHCACMQQHT